MSCGLRIRLILNKRKFGGSRYVAVQVPDPRTVGLVQHPSERIDHTAEPWIRVTLELAEKTLVRRKTTSAVPPGSGIHPSISDIICRRQPLCFQQHQIPFIRHGVGKREKDLEKEIAFQEASAKGGGGARWTWPNRHVGPREAERD